MAKDENEEKLLRSVALQNAQSILLARPARGAGAHRSEGDVGTKDP